MRKQMHAKKSEIPLGSGQLRLHTIMRNSAREAVWLRG